MLPRHRALTTPRLRSPRLVSSRLAGLLDANGGVDVQTLPVSSVLLPHECAESMGEGSSLALSQSGRDLAKATSGGLALFNFYDLSKRVSEHEGGRGVLIGWRRAQGEPCLNPLDKEETLPWGASDELIVVTRYAHKMRESLVGGVRL